LNSLPVKRLFFFTPLSQTRPNLRLTLTLDEPTIALVKGGIIFLKEVFPNPFTGVNKLKLAESLAL